MSYEIVAAALQKPLEALTISELQALTRVPEEFWPENKTGWTVRTLNVEIERRLKAGKPTIQEVFDATIGWGTAKLLLGNGPDLGFPGIDKNTIWELRAELDRRKKDVENIWKRYKS